MSPGFLFWKFGTCSPSAPPPLREKQHDANLAIKSGTCLFCKARLSSLRSCHVVPHIRYSGTAHGPSVPCARKWERVSFSAPLRLRSTDAPRPSTQRSSRAHVGISSADTIQPQMTSSCNQAMVNCDIGRDYHDAAADVIRSTISTSVPRTIALVPTHGRRESRARVW